MSFRRGTRLDTAEARRLLRQRTGRAHVVLTGRGATAIWAALGALGLHNAQVLIPANTCYLVLWAVLETGNIPVLVDVDPDTGCMTAETLARAAVAHPAAIIPTHLYGIPAPMAELTAWAWERGALVIEDCAQTLQAGDTRADVTIYSFGRGKPADIDNGGASLTGDSALAADMLRLVADLPRWNAALRRRSHEWLDLYWALHQHDSANPALAALYPPLFALYRALVAYRLPDAAWREFPTALSAHDASADQHARRVRQYDAAFASTGLHTLRYPASARLWRYPLRVPAGRRDWVLHALWEAGVTEATRWYPSLQPMHAALAPDAPVTATPAADQLAAEIINLPLDADDVQPIIDVVLRTFEP